MLPFSSTRIPLLHTQDRLVQRFPSALATGDNEATAFLVAFHPGDNIPIGFVYAATNTNFFTGEQHAHVKDLVVAKNGEGKGVARKLLSAVEAWAKSREYRFITLSVFPQNSRAVKTYERGGYSIDVLRMLKPI
jgi:ribosomal protein S18 acetylase RimI-like enzyme